MLELWEILIPTTIEGISLTVGYHMDWDSKVRKITKGLTILNTVSGQWEPYEDDIYEERMIPVRIACTKEQLEEILSFTIKYYKQKEIFAYRISDKIIAYKLDR